MRFFLPLVLFFAIYNPAAGVVIFQDNFDAHPVNTPIYDLAPQIGPDWQTSGPFDPNFAYITAATGPDRELTINSLPGSGTPYVFADVTSHARFVQMSFDLNVPSGTTVNGAALFAFDTGTLLDGIALISTGFFSDGLILPKVDIAGDYKIAVTMYFDTDEIEVWIDDLATTVVGDAMQRTATIVPIDHLEGFDFELPYGGSGSINIDNVLIVAIPEPNSFAMITVTALLLGAARRRSGAAALDA